MATEAPGTTSSGLPSLPAVATAAMLSGASTWESRPLPQADIPVMVWSDGPHGIRRQLGDSDHLGIAGSQPATCFPTAATIANSWDVELATEIGQALGAEAAEQKVDVLLGPGLNIKRNPLCGRNFEYFSEDPVLAGDLAAAYVTGIQTQGVAGCPKHFAANSQETARMTSDSVVDERTLREIYLVGFERVVRQAAPWALMTAYNRINGTYANENSHLLQDILRDEWGFDGAVVSDWGGSNDAVAAAAAGAALEMPSPGFGSTKELLDALAAGRLDQNDVDARVLELAKLAGRTRRDDVPATDGDAHHALARRAAAESVVLLRNEEDLLPLPAGTKVAVVGDFAQTPRYQGAGSSLVNARNLVTPLEALQASELDVVGYAQGFPRSGDGDAALVAEAVDLASKADVVLAYLGLDELAETEGRDRATMAMAPSQVELLRKLAAANPRVVVVLSAGSAVELDWLGDGQALVHGYLGGEGGAEGMVDVLTGAVNPGGRLAETYPIRLADVPSAAEYPGQHHVLYREGPFIGYRYFTTADKPVRFPFGFGLSYTTFEISGLEVSDEGARVTVTNTGSVSGSEVVQLYVGRVGEIGVIRPRRELKGYAKVRLAAGESSVVEIPFDETTFRHFAVETNSWEVETARYRIEIGRNASEIVASAELEVEGSVALDAGIVTRLPHYASGDVLTVPDAEFEALLGHAIPLDPSGQRELGPNDPLGAMSAAKSPLARWAAGILRGRLRKSEAKGSPDLNMLFLLAMPFRALAKMTNGAVTMPMVDAILRIVNGHFFSGTGQLISAWWRGRGEAKKLSQEFDAATQQSQKN